MKLNLALLVSSSLLLSCCAPGAGFREKMAALDWGGDTCYVFGHKAPDVDAVGSAIGYAELMQRLGYKCEARTCGPVNKETLFASEMLGFSLPAVMQSVEPGTRIILTDHSEYVQSVEGVREALILQLIDHHIPGDIDTCSIPFVVSERIGSASTLVWELYGKAGLEPSGNSARALLAGILSDTKSLTKKGATTLRDTIACTALAEQLALGPQDLAEIGAGMAEASRSYEGMSDEEIFLSDCKTYQHGGNTFRVGSLDWFDTESQDAFLDRMLSTMKSLAGANEMMFAKVDVKEEGCYVLFCGPGAAEAARKAFGAPIREGVCFHPAPLNRKYQMVPMLQEAMSEPD